MNVTKALEAFLERKRLLDSTLTQEQSAYETEFMVLIIELIWQCLCYLKAAKWGYYMQIIFQNIYA